MTTHASLLLASLALLSPAVAGVHLRWNQAGYDPRSVKEVVAMSEDNLEGTPWGVTRDGLPVLRGVWSPAVTATEQHSPFRYNHRADLSSLQEPGTYLLVAEGEASAHIRLVDTPSAALLEKPLQHLRAMRSGSHATRLRAYSHGGDARALVWLSRGDPTEGRWQPHPEGRTVDALGGWYDAGDQIKFTLNQASTVYHLLLAYSLKPELFRTVAQESGLPEVLDEARHGLEFLMRVHPDSATFIIQVGNAEDHNQPLRLPENDLLDGRRPALCALSRVHMGAAAAALAKGAQIFARVGRVEEAERYGAAAKRIFLRALAPDTVETAFERDEVNDFYHDVSAVDQLALAAVELHRLFGDQAFLDQALRLAPPAATEVSWGDWHWLANLQLAPHSGAARDRLSAELERYLKTRRESGAPWGIPGRYVWGSLHRWIGMANACRLSSLQEFSDTEMDALGKDIVDYTFGRNNWGVSFLFSRSLPNSLRHLYSPAYKLLGAFPEGALSEGPGDRATHDSLRKWFEIPADDPFHAFNTAEGVFFDNDTDFMCQEATITGQADLVLLLTLDCLFTGRP